MIEIDYIHKTLTQKRKDIVTTRELKTEWLIGDKLEWLYGFLKCFKADEPDLEKVKINYKKKIVKLYYKENRHIRFEYFEDLSYWRKQQYKRIRKEIKYSL